MNKKSIIKKILYIVMWLILLLWMVICLIDFYNTRNHKKPMFCIKKETIKYEDGNVNVCTGLLYKIYHYDRNSYKAYEFGPIWTKDRSNKESK